MSCTITVVGNLGRNASFSEGTAGPMTKFSMAASKKQKDGNFDSAWFDVACFKYLAQNTQNLEKGQRVLVIGDFWPRSYTGKDGVLKTAYQITAREVHVIERKKETPPPGNELPIEDSTFQEIPF